MYSFRSLSALRCASSAYTSAYVSIRQHTDVHPLPHLRFLSALHPLPHLRSLSALRCASSAYICKHM
jgi:hypothetical protein